MTQTSPGGVSSLDRFDSPSIRSLPDYELSVTCCFEREAQLKHLLFLISRAEYMLPDFQSYQFNQEADGGNPYSHF